jgi:energy-coupling factor transporter ATP-binding protein EcfA2
MDLLRVEGLQVRYPIHKEPSIKDVSFIMKKGELVLLTGKSGCGKSTLLKCINLTIPHFIQAESILLLTSFSIRRASLAFL